MNITNRPHNNLGFGAVSVRVIRPNRINPQLTAKLNELASGLDVRFQALRANGPERNLRREILTYKGPEEDTFAKKIEEAAAKPDALDHFGGAKVSVKKIPDAPILINGRLSFNHDDTAWLNGK